MQPAVSPRTVQRHWRAAFRTAAANILDDLAPRGVADLCTDYAMPLSGEALRLITGLDNVSAKQMDAHSQAMIDGISNYAGDADTEARWQRLTWRSGTGLPTSPAARLIPNQRPAFR